ncbi:class I SAM-dependent methyltransferase [Funiculus sociatus GB2-A5]|uniref:Class I SAM-dependent methyltransferase n=1 Tax=Funiculus sociatus GB2-A5 TaxID=2933946 RepID=A0ABV0JVV6_9CYAN|nr:class I SAM-dependent methyltransferase [Trichocoleus sp. FACHB-6]MBD2063792.1 class I SAM-dependent methyltransferase [Trichocoleus sp. FACHB-6]
MTSTSVLENIEKYIPLVGDVNIKTPLAYKTSRGAVKVVNAAQMAVAEAYINGFEVPDAVLRSLFDTFMPILFKYFPSLLAPYDWVLKETDHLAEGSRDLMKLQYDLPQAMLNTMLGDGKLIYPKYSMALWEKGAANLEQAQMQMIDDVIEKLEIKDGDNILDFGCGWGCVPNYILSKFPNVKFTGINLSHEQCEYMRGKMQDPESYLSSERFTLYEGDLNDAFFDTKFDKILSIGVFCHVGNLTKAFQKLASFLKEDGKVFIHIITVRTPNNISSVYTHKYIFPHGRYWNFDAVPSHNKDLKTIERWYLNGYNYSTTFANWLKNFDDNQATNKQLDYGIEYAKFRRIWRFYLLWFVRNFACCNGEYNGNGQFLLTHA